MVKREDKIQNTGNTQNTEREIFSKMVVTELS